MQPSTVITTAPALDIVVAVYNEQAALEGCVRRLRGYLASEVPYTARITIADNASSDRTLPIAQALAAEFPDVRVLHLDEKGRGRALRTAWGRSDARVLVYMDVDMSTGLDALMPLVAPLLSGTRTSRSGPGWPGRPGCCAGRSASSSPAVTT